MFRFISVPSKAPTITKSKDTGSYKIEVEWITFAEVFWTGIPYNCYIYYQVVGENIIKQVNVSSSLNKLELTGLESYTDYAITVAAATVIGIGPKSAVKKQKSGIAGKTFERTASALFSSNSYVIQFYNI